MMEDRMDLPETGADFVREEPREMPHQDEGRQAEGQGAQEPSGQPQGEVSQPSGEGAQPGHQEMIPHARFHAVNEELRGYKDRFGSLESRYNERERLIAEQAQQLNHVLGLLQQGQRGQPQAQAQPQQPQADWWQDPDAAFAHNIERAISPLQQRLDRQREGFSQMLAVEKFGAETVSTATSELQRRMQADPNGMAYTYRAIMDSPHPYGALVNWHKEQSALSQYGSDPSAFIEAEIQRRLAEMGQQPAPQSQAAPPSQPTRPAAPPQMPSSFAAARNGAPRGAPQASGPRSLSDIMGR
ncbi:hypothetical protein C0214_19640 [Methylobacterium sp. DM1]|nr:hypothetical protein C0214_19640 [Methylobacterium sp. DM1]